MTGEGVVDFRRDRVWLIRPLALVSRGSVRQFRNVTRESREGETPGARRMKRAYAFFLGQASRRSREWHFEGMTRYKRKRSGSWSEGFALRSPYGAESSREDEHPLWLLGPLAKLQGEIEEIGDGELIGEAATVRYSISLTEVEITPAAWEFLAHPDSPGPDVPLGWWEGPPRSKARGAIPAQAWIDAEGRIRRMGFEVNAWHPMSFRGREQASDSLWSVTELWDFGVEINRPPPSNAA